MKTSEVLKKARELITDPKHWTQGVFARDKRGLLTSSNSPTAVCFCAAGAIHRAAGGMSHAVLALHRLKTVMKYPIPRFNDTGTHAEVLEAFDKAIAAEECEEA